MLVEIDQLTQRTAANSEQSTAASEELSAQAESLRDVVHRLEILIGGEGKRSLQL